MESLKEQISKLIELMGFNKFEIETNLQDKKISINLEDEIVNIAGLPMLVLNINRIVRLIAKKNGVCPVIVDINNYRKKREELIIELARAAARRAVVMKELVSLPAMNAYERLLIHTELSMRPDVVTESVGEGRNRYVTVKATT